MSAFSGQLTRFEPPDPGPERASIRLTSVVRCWTFSGRAKTSWLSEQVRSSWARSSSRPFCPLLLGLVLASHPSFEESGPYPRSGTASPQPYEQYLAGMPRLCPLERI